MTPGRPVLITGLGVRSAFGSRGTALAEAVEAGRPAFAEVTRFPVAGRRTTVAATAPDAPRLADRLTEVVAETGAPGDAPLLLALHADRRTGPLAAEVAARTGRATRVYTGACVAASTAVADAAALIAGGRIDRAVVAAGYLVEPDTFAVFDAGRALATDGALRPFSRGRRGMLLGDAVVAVLLEARSARPPLARLAGWGRSGDAYHVCRPRPDGAGLARAVRTALDRAGAAASEVGWVNANGAGSELGDRAEAAALGTVFGPSGPPVSSTKSVHGHALEASALLELAVTVGVLERGRLPVNAGWLGPDPDCPLDLVLDAPRPHRARYALSVNAAFGGANTALLVAAA
ncbi:beta-ketoacyl synthase N-terminal-like domain-containing protein [Kitasatospora sp. NPDC048365]|uniref:beta-ketoacyl synthase N-terminal-like domain-containing protein n=1 Tax=Kitasatospora sp. NPDC048365 TaxID=3364050 RepID=UPI00371A29B4